MYESHFSLLERPFGSAPVTASYFPGEAIESARQALISSLERDAGPGLVVGPSGSGKTLLCQLIAERFADDFQVVSFGAVPEDSPKNLLRCILHGLGLPHQNVEEGEMRLSLIDYLEPHPRCQNGVLLVADEAHLAEPRWLEELRMLTNLVRGGRIRVRLVLAGSSLLEETFAHPRLDSFSQRIAARCYLGPFNAAETAAYVEHQVFRVSETGNGLFDGDALDSIFAATDGVPRLVNQLCDHALCLGARTDVSTITMQIIQEAWADLQQLPVPCAMEEPGSGVGGSVIEFGELTDEEEQTDSADVPTNPPTEQDDRTYEEETVEWNETTVEWNAAEFDLGEAYGSSEDVAPAVDFGAEPTCAGMDAYDSQVESDRPEDIVQEVGPKMDDVVDAVNCVDQMDEPDRQETIEQQTIEQEMIETACDSQACEGCECSAGSCDEVTSEPSSANETSAEEIPTDESSDDEYTAPNSTALAVHNPFEENFDDEEVIIQPSIAEIPGAVYVTARSPDNWNVPSAAVPACESFETEIAPADDPVYPQEPLSSGEPVALDDTTTQESCTEDICMYTDGSTDDYLRTHPEIEAAPTILAGNPEESGVFVEDHRTLDFGLHVTAPDDRDLIIVEDAPYSIDDDEQHEYNSLLSQLRQPQPTS